MKSVIAGIAPGIALIDLSHDVPPQDIRTGAWILHTTWRYLPAGGICLAVVDPGVGSARRAVAFAAGERLFVGPDNGLFGYILEVGPASAAVALDNPRFQLAAPSATFHGRDIFAPAAAHLAAGQTLVALGSPISPTSLTPLALPRPTRQGNDLVGHVIHVDHFGNLITSFGPKLARALLSQPGLALRVADRTIAASAGTFASGPVDEPFALMDSSGHLALALRDGSAAKRLGVSIDAAILAIGAAALDSPAAP